MQYPKNNLCIKSFLKAMQVDPSDLLMLHADAGVAAQLQFLPIQERLNYLIHNLIEYFDDSGALLVPTFSYSFTAGEYFDRENSPSLVGQFSETFRQHASVKRTSHPIFSFGISGIRKDIFMDADNTTCFGEKSVFDILKQANGKIMCLGCMLERITFIHHIEQMFQVPYRYSKSFRGKIIQAGDIYKTETEYFVRDRNIRTELNLKRFQKRLMESNDLKVEQFGRFNGSVLSSKAAFDTGFQMLAESKFSLIEAIDE